MGEAVEAAADAPSFRLCIVVVADVAGIGVMTTAHRPPNAVHIAPLHPPAYPAAFVTCRHRHSISVGEGQGRAGEVESASLALPQRLLKRSNNKLNLNIYTKQIIFGTGTVVVGTYVVPLLERYGHEGYLIKVSSCNGLGRGGNSRALPYTVMV